MNRNNRLLVVLVLLMGFTAIPSSSQSNQVLRVVIDDEITGATVLIIDNALEKASQENMQAIILELNTPGGDGEATFDIMDLVMNSPVPVIGYVTPIGANAFSAGTYILMSTHVAAMAPGASIGSGQPVSSTGELINNTKTINALTNKMIGAARVHNRNETAARLFIDTNLNLNTHEARSSNVIEIMPSNYQDLLIQLENRILVRYSDNWQLYLDTDYPPGDPGILQTWDFLNLSRATSHEFSPSIILQLLDILSDPNLAYILLLIGTWALILGLQTPGFGSEIIGAVSLVLGMVGVGIIGLSFASFLLFSLGGLLLVLELKFHTVVLTAGGTFCLLLGSLFIVPSDWILTQSAINSIRYGLFAITGTIACIFGFAVYKASQARRRPPKLTFSGKIGIATSDIDPEGTVRFQGAIWNTKLLHNNPVKKDQKVQIARIEGLTLIVEPVSS